MKFIKLTLVDFIVNDKGREREADFSAKVFEARRKVDNAGEYEEVEPYYIQMANKEYDFKDEDFDQKEYIAYINRDEIEAYTETDTEKVSKVSTRDGGVYLIRESIEKINELINI